MPAIKLEQFGGMLPAWDPRLLPTGQSALARNGYLFSGSLTGWRKPKILRALNNSAARFAYRVPTITEVQARAYLVFLDLPQDGDTVTIGDQTYTFRNDLVMHTTITDFSAGGGETTVTGEPFEVAIPHALFGVDRFDVVMNLAHAITADDGQNTNAGVQYGDATPLNTDVRYFLPDTDHIPGLVEPNWAVEAFGASDYHYLQIGAVDFGASYNSISVSESTGGARMKWVYDLDDLAHTTTTYRGGTNPSFSNDLAGAATWLEFVDPDTTVFKSPIVDDQWNRYYSASPTVSPHYNTGDRIANGDPFWMLGVPSPGCAVLLGVTGGGNNMTLGNFTPSGGEFFGLPNRIYVTKVHTTGDTVIQDVKFTLNNGGGLVPPDGFPDAHFAAVVFTDIDGKAGDLLNTGLITHGINGDGPQTSSFLNPTNLSGNEDYWIGIMFDTAVPLAAGPAGGASNTDSWSNTFTNGPPVTAPHDLSARTSLVSDGTNVNDGDVVLVGLNAYVFLNTLSAPTGSGQVHIGANADASLTNLEHAINASGGTPGVDWSSGTAANFYCVAAAVTNHAIEITAKSQDTPFDIVPTTFTPAGSAHLTFDGPTLEPGYQTNGTGLNMWGDFITTDVIESRSYVYTWVSEYGEEGAPSPPTLLDGWSNGTWTISLWQPPPNDLGILRNLKRINIYRTVPGVGGQTAFFFVDSVEIGTDLFVDATPNNTVALNDQLQSTNWFPPPENLQGFTVMQNGMVAAFTKNEIWFCEPYHPHAWPPAYVMTVDFPIVGMGLTNGALVVCTAANPYVISGSAPASMAQSKCADANPCSSRASILSGDGAVSFMSPNGLIQVTAAGTATNTTDLWWTRENWSQLVPQHDARAIFLASCYFCLGSVSRDGLDNSVAQQGFTIELDQDNTSFTIWPQPGGHRLGLELMDSPTGFDCQGLFTDPWTGKGLTIADGNLYYWDFTDPAPALMTYTWRSKFYQQNAKRNYSAMKVFFRVPPGTPALNPTRIEKVASDPAWATLGADRYGYIKTYVDKDNDGSLTLIDCREIRKSGELLRIIDGFKTDTWQWEVVSRVVISNIQVATSVKELAQV